MSDQSSDNLLPLLLKNNIQGSYTQTSFLLEKKNREANQIIIYKYLHTYMYTCIHMYIFPSNIYLLHAHVVNTKKKKKLSAKANLDENNARDTNLLLNQKKH